MNLLCKVESFRVVAKGVLGLGLAMVYFSMNLLCKVKVQGY
jgi:hypothetical protein